MGFFSDLEHTFSALERPFPVLERPFPVSERHFPILERPNFCFRTSFSWFLGGDFVPGRPRRVCPGTFAPALVPGQRETGIRKKFCPGTKGQWDVQSRFVPGRPVPCKHYTKS